MNNKAIYEIDVDRSRKIYYCEPCVQAMKLILKPELIKKIDNE